MSGRQDGGESGRRDPREWVDTYGDVLYRYALARLSDAQTAEDVVQETFLAALQAHEQFSGESAEQTWLVSILRHKIADHYRRVARSRTGARSAQPAEFDDEGYWIAGPQPWRLDPAKIVENHEFWTVFESCRSKLPEKLAETYQLREDAGLTTEEICQLLDISASNVWTQLYRARLMLRRCVERNWFQSDEGDAR